MSLITSMQYLTTSCSDTSTFEFDESYKMISDNTPVFLGQSGQSALSLLTLFVILEGFMIGVIQWAYLTLSVQCHIRRNR